MTEAEQLAELLASEQEGGYFHGWNELRDPGYALDGWTTVDVQDNGSGRWSAYKRAITKNDASGNHYAWHYEEGLTEYQEDAYYEELPELVVPVEKTVVVTTWEVVK